MSFRFTYETESNLNPMTKLNLTKECAYDETK